MDLQITAIIPARLKSQRLKEKLLIEVDGKSILEHVHERVLKSKLFDQVIIATDSKKIYKIAEGFGAMVLMTSISHKSGTDRIAEVARKIRADVIVNVQGDEPLISKSHLSKIVDLVKLKKVEIATLCTSFESNKSLQDPSNVKVVCDKNGKALYFSRSVIPYPRADVLYDAYDHHIGLYAFKRKTLLKVSKLKQSRLEIYEQLEQLRWLENGFDIHVGKVNKKTISIDTMDDLKMFKAALQKRTIKRKRK